MSEEFEGRQVINEEEEFFVVELSRTEYRPGENVEGNVQWCFSEPAESVEVRLVVELTGNWNTEKSYAAGVQWNDLPSAGICTFSLLLPEGPYSFIGQKIRIDWSVEVQCETWGYEEEAEFSFSPTGEILELKSRKDPK